MNDEPQKVYVTDSNLGLFAQMARDLMENSDHMHAGMDDNGRMMVYPCGCGTIYVFELAVLDDFVERRNVAIANGSQYDVLFSVLNMIKQAEAQKYEPKQEPEVSFPNQPRLPSTPAVFGEQAPQQNLLQLLADKIKSDLETRPKVWQVKASYGNEDGDEYGTMSFGARDLYEVADRLSNIDLQNGTFINIDLEYYTVED